jgi:hypothetical protein
VLTTSCSDLPLVTSKEPITSTGEPTTGSSDSLRARRVQPHIGLMHLDLTGEETTALIQELHEIVESNRYPFSSRIRTRRGILAKLRPEPGGEPLPPPKAYAPPSKGRYRRRG